MFMQLRKILKSRPDPEHGLAVTTLSDAELELISAFLWSTKLGNGVSPHRDAAYSLMTKIEELKGDNFTEYAAHAVDLQVDVMDYNGNLIQSVSHKHLEFDV